MKIALLGAESTGKTALAQALAAHLQMQREPAVAVNEYLREWSDAHQRVPQAHEQLCIANTQRQRIDAAALTASCVIANTTPLTIALNSDYFFNDLSLYPAALAYQRGFGVTLVMGLAAACAGCWMLDAEKIPYSMVYGQDNTRLANALAVIKVSTQNAIYSVAASAISTLAAAQKASKLWVWMCDKCSDPDCEHALFTSLHKN